MSDLENVFYAFCDAVKKGSKTGGTKMIKKLCTDSKLYSGSMNANIVDIQLSKQLGNQKKELNYQEFVQFIEGPLSEVYMKAKNLQHADAVQEIKNKIIASSPQAHGATKVSSDAATARMTDVKGYTGAHKERFDAETGKGKGIEGREYIMDEKAAAGYVSGYKGKDTYDKKHSS